MIAVRVRIEMGQARAQLERLRALDIEGALQIAAVEAQAGIANNFAAQRSGQGPWPALADLTLILREERGYPYPEYPMLVNTGRYRESWLSEEAVTLSGSSVTIASSDHRVERLSKRRPVHHLQDADRERVIEATTRYLIEVATDAG